MENRVVITGYHVLLPQVSDNDSFHQTLINGNTTYSFQQELKESKFNCQVAGLIEPQLIDSLLAPLIQDQLLLDSSINTKMALYSGISAWSNAGLLVPNDETVDWDAGIMIGSSIGTIDMIVDKVCPALDRKRIKRIGSLAVQNVMLSNSSAHLSNILNTGSITSGVSNSCNSSTDAIVQAYHRIKDGRGNRYLVGGVEEASPFIHGLFEPFIVNEKSDLKLSTLGGEVSIPTDGIVLSGGASMLVLEEYNIAKNRGANILAEIKSVCQNRGSLEQGDGLSLSNQDAIIQCICKSIEDAKISASDIQLINGQFNGLKSDITEINNWTKAFKMHNSELPYIQSSKGICGHSMGASGAVEICAVLDQMQHNYIHPNINRDALRDGTSGLISKDKVLSEKVELHNLRTVIKANFGFGGVNSALVLQKYAS